MRREYPTRPIVGVGAAIVQGEKLVLVKRGVEPDKGKWSIPGGVVELGETIRDATIREAKEECGLEIELVGDRPMDALDKMVPSENGRLQYHYVLLQFLARPKGGNLKPTSDAIEAIWVHLAEVGKFNLTDSFRAFFEKHRKELEGF